jgi:uncharacterized sulfatase
MRHQMTNQIVVAGLISLLAVGSLFSQEKPDILIYLSDDHSQADSSLYGNENIPTPHMEQLAADGVTLTHAFVASPSCAPSRAAMLTGLWPARNGAEGNHEFPKASVDRERLVNELQNAGYEVAAFGKVAHGRTENSYGFDHVNDASGGVLAGNVESWLRSRTSTKPLCLFVGTSDPHVLWSSPSSFDTEEIEFPPHHLDTPSTRAHRARYYEEIKELDEVIGELRGFASEYMNEDLLFIHTSDHGSQWAFGKWTLYDYGIRVPFVAAWPGRITPGSVSDAMVSWVDIIPTLIDVVGGSTPEDTDGFSFREVLEGEETTHRDRIFSTHTSDLAQNAHPSRSVRTDEWKLIRNFRSDLAFTNHTDLLRKQWAGAYWSEWVGLARNDEDAQAILDRYYVRPEFELYHMPSDPWELNNVADDPTNEVLLAQLTTELSNWMAEQGDNVSLTVQTHPLDQPETWHPDYFESLLNNGGFSEDDPLGDHFVASSPTGWTDGGAAAADSGVTQSILEIFDGESADGAYLHPLGGQGNSSVDLNNRSLQQTVTEMGAGKSYNLAFTFFNAALGAEEVRRGVAEVRDGDGNLLASQSSQELGPQEMEELEVAFAAPADGMVIVSFHTTVSSQADSGIHLDNVTLLSAGIAEFEPANLPEDLFLDSFNRPDSLEHGSPTTGMAGSRLALCTPSMGGNQKGFKSPVY